MEIGLRVAACETDNLVRTGTRLPDIKGFVVQVENGNTAFAQAFENLALGFDDLVRAAEFTNVGSTGVVDDDNLRLRQAYGVADFANARGAQLDHCRAVLRCDLQQCQRCTEVIVQVAAGGVHQATGTQDAGEHFLDRGLAAGTGNGHYRLVESGAVQCTELAEGQAAIGHLQLRQVDIGYFTLDQGGYCAFGFHVCQVVMAIETRAGQGDEQLPGADTAAIDADAGERGVATDVLTLQCCGQLAE
ncbi:hypothetical protein D3C80_1216380 [compost metagenome]